MIVDYVLGAIVLGQMALLGLTTVTAARERVKLEARITALALARTPQEYAGLLRAETAPSPRPQKVKRRRGKDTEDDRERYTGQPIGLGGEWG